MLWLTLSLLTALAASSQDAWCKKFFSHLNLYEMAMYPMLYSLPMFAMALPFIPVPPGLDMTFLWCLVVSIPLNSVAFLLYIKAIRISPLSLTLPYLAFTPGFMVFTGYVFLNELPNIWGIAGILVICGGSYILNIVPGKWSFLEPLKAVLREPGSRLMLINSFLFSFGAVIGKKGILHSSPLFFTLSFFCALNLFLFLFLLSIGKIHVKVFQDAPLKGIFTGSLVFMHVICHGWAISLTKAAYMIAVKRLSVMFGILYGRLLFKEENMAFRLGGAVLMLAGTLLITIQGI